MTRHLFVVSSDAADGQDDDYHKWYDEEHLPAVLAVPGFVRAQRFVAVPATRGDLPPRRYLTIYEIESDDLPATLAALNDAAKGMHISSALDRTTATSFAYTALGPAQEAR